MHRVWAIIERDLRRFRRSPVLVIVSIIMPLVQLVVLGYAFGGKIKNLQVGVVDEDHSVPAVKLQEMFQAVAANAKTFTPVYYSDKGSAERDLRNGKIVVPQGLCDDQRTFVTTIEGDEVAVWDTFSIKLTT